MNESRDNSEARAFALGIATEIRAEMARQQKTQAQLAEAIGVTSLTAQRRLNAVAPFDTVEVYKVARWLGVRPEQFYPRTGVA